MFHAAASLQLSCMHDSGCEYSRTKAQSACRRQQLLVVSPYTALPQLLDLDSVSPQCQLLAKALTVLKPVRRDYATAPYVQAFNWSDVFKLLQRMARQEDQRWSKQSFYIVVFRSRLKAGVDRSELAALDKLAHEEASLSGGLLKYWYGVPDADDRNLATC